jgi:hypothetical protein
LASLCAVVLLACPNCTGALPHLRKLNWKTPEQQQTPEPKSTEAYRYHPTLCSTSPLSPTFLLRQGNPTLLPLSPFCSFPIRYIYRLVYLDPFGQHFAPFPLIHLLGQPLRCCSRLPYNCTYAFAPFTETELENTRTEIN